MKAINMQYTNIKSLFFSNLYLNNKKIYQENLCYNNSICQKFEYIYIKSFKCNQEYLLQH